MTNSTLASMTSPSRARIPALLLALLGAACGGSTAAPSDGGVDSGSSQDATQKDVAPLPDAPEDQSTSNPCDAGTCRQVGDPAGTCLPPGGPISMGGDAAPTLGGCCACGADGFCSSECVCASPDTPIATPTGDRPIASLSVGDLVLSIDRGRLAAVPVRQTHRSPVKNHRVIEVVLRDGVVLRISAAHPTADGRSFGQLHAGDWLGGREVASVKVVPYAHDATYDILPDSDTGTYFAGGALIGSTLATSAPAAAHVTAACTLPASSAAP
jgi:hypothetical protein